MSPLTKKFDVIFYKNEFLIIIHFDVFYVVVIVIIINNNIIIVVVVLTLYSWERASISLLNVQC